MVETLGKYTVDGYIAEGGMARILRAKTEGIGGVKKTVALKCLKGALQEDDNFVQMLRDEALITVNMTHKNICQVYGLEHDGDTYFMVMEHIDGVNLAELANYLFSLNRVFPIEAAVFITMEICSGLSYAHRLADESGESLGIVHRDVTPQNICISKEGEVKLIDFGIAKARLATQETQAGAIKGKFNYMSPEQARGDRVDQRTDVFALGAVLYEMLCGHMLYPLSLDESRLRTKARMADFVPIESYLPDLPEKLKKIVAKALARDINQRFPTSRDFLLALTQFFHDSCKVYDALNLSMLVEKYLASKPLSTSSTTNKAVKSSSTNMSVKRDVSFTANAPTFPIDSSDTAVISVAETKRLSETVSNDGSDESATNVYSKEAFEEAVAASGSLLSDVALNRSVDLDIEEVNRDETVMYNINAVDYLSPDKKIFFYLGKVKSSVKKLFHKIISLDERTLTIAAISLIGTLLVVLILFFAFGSDDEEKAKVTVTPAPAPQDTIRTINIDSTPSGASIFYQDKDSGMTTPAGISSDKDIIILKMPFYRDSAPIHLKSAEVATNLNVELVPLECRVNFDSDPSGATVIIDEQEKGKTPMTSVLPMNKKYHVTLRKSGYKSVTDTIEWASDSERSLDFSKNLKKKII